MHITETINRKVSLRQKSYDALLQMSVDGRLDASSRIWRRFEQSLQRSSSSLKTAFESSSTIAAYLPQYFEVQFFQSLVSFCELKRKYLVLPKIQKDENGNRVLQFFRYYPRYSALVLESSNSLWQPHSSAAAIDLNEIGFVLFPGLQFSEDFHRLGRGAGHYDRTFQNHIGFRLAFAFEEQVVEKSESEMCKKTDLRVHGIITESRSIV